MNHPIHKCCGLLSLVLALASAQSARSQSEKAEVPAAELQFTPRSSAERHMKDPEAVPITAEWMKANPGRLVVTLDAACNGEDTYYFELHTSKEAVFHTRTIIWAAVEPKTGEVPLFAAVSTHTTTSPSKKLKFSVSIPRGEREVEAVVEVKELRTFTIDGKATLGASAAVDVLFANAREPDMTRYTIRVTDPAILHKSLPSSDRDREQSKRP